MRTVDMTNISAEERQAICDGFGRLLADKCSEADMRRAMETPDGHDAELWRAMSQMGIVGLLAPAEHGGVGAGPIEIEAVMEEAGAALLAGPFLSSAVLATGMLMNSADTEAKARLLPEIASGEQIATVAFTDDRGTWDPDSVGVTARPQGDSWALDGEASFVTAANIADILLVVARTPQGLGCFQVSPATAGVKIKPLQTWDRTIRLSRISFAGAAAVTITGADEAAIERTLDLARVALAGEQAGAARKIFDITVDYLKTRIQFGRPIGGFQALKHMAADLLIEVESATSAARAAAQALHADAPDKDVLVNLAAFACADAFSQVAASAIQMHGGIAFTWEHPAHLYLRRARASAQLFGQSDRYRERYLAAQEKLA